MKFISLFFLFALFLIVNTLAHAHTGRGVIYKPLADTIIKLDSTNKYPKLTKGKKSKATPVVKKVVTTDTSKNKSNLDAQLTEKADSSFNDIEKGLSYRWGHARVTYGDFELDAEYIKIDRKSHLIFASGVTDPKTHRYIGRPISKQGSDAPITSDSLLYNYDTKKGNIWNVLTAQDGNYISHGQAKKISETEVAYKNIIFSACDKPDPDYGIVITRGIGEKKRIISGPAYLEIEGIPIPIGIPFGFFPKPDTRTSGVILPTFGEDATLGFYLRDFGYYLGLSDYADLTNMGTYYSNGSYEVNSTLEYKDRYKYSGNLQLSYGSHNYNLAGDPPQRDFHINWTHTQNPNASPGSTFSASVNAGTSTFYSNNPASINYNLQALTNNTLRSAISYSRTFDDGKFNLTVSLQHSQELSQKTVSLTLPSFTFSMITLNPFDSKERVGEQKWYQKITVGYNLVGSNAVSSVPESQLFTKETLTKRFISDFQHTIPVGLSLNVLKYFQFSVSFNYTERWHLQTIREHYARADSLVTDTVAGFERVGSYSASTNLSTKVYGTINFKNSTIKAIRHVMTPSIGFSYSPDYSSLDRSYNRSIVSNATVPYPVVSSRYSIFNIGTVGGPGGGRQENVNFSIDNSLEAKVKARSTDTSKSDRKVQLLQSLSIGASYNLAADSFKLSPIQVSGHTSIIHDRISLGFGATFNPYVTRIIDSISNGAISRTAIPVNRYTFQDGALPTLSNFNFTASGSLNPDAFRSVQTKPLMPVGTSLNAATSQQLQELALLSNDANRYVDFNIPWNVNINYQFNYSNNYTSTFVTNTVSFVGDLNLTPKWKITYNTSLDLRTKKLEATSFSIYRDLHCWDLSAQWVPFGYYKSYNVTLRVKSTILQALKLTKRNDYTSSTYFAQ